MIFRDMVNEIKAEHHLDTDYKVHKLLRISRSRFYSALSRGSMPEDDVIITCETLLNAPPGSLLLEAHSERTKCPEAAKILHELAIK